MTMAVVSWSGRARTKGYRKCHGKKHAENKEKISSVFSVLISVAKRLLLFAKELTVSNTNEAAMTAAESPQFWSGSATPDKNPLYFLTLHAVPSKLSGRAQ